MLFEKIINTIFSFGAAIVIFGAWGKLEHKDFSDSVLTIGMLVETGIFCIYGMMEWMKKPEVRDQSFEQHAEGADMSELTTTMKQTNEILNKVFK
jgi:predicted double-glycine peptidase